MPSNHLMRFDAFGTVGVVGVTEAGSLSGAAAIVERTVAEFDRACSRFRSDSELSALNAAAGTSFRVGPVLLDAVSAALRAARLTGGDVDPTVGEALIALGYDRDFAELASDASDLTPRAPRPIATIPRWRAVTVNAQDSTVRLTPGVTLDLGATAKALAADRAAARVLEATGSGVLVSFGGDLAIAGTPPPEGWRVRVTDDHRAGAEAPGQWITLHSGGLATSSTFVRRWRTASGVAHHLIDPATGQPTDSVWRTASVTAGSCLDANIASTAAIIRGPESVAWLEGMGLPSRLVGVDGSVRHVAGWPAEGDESPSAATVAAGNGGGG